MTPLITREPPDSADAIQLIAELDAHLGAIYPVESRHGFSVEKLLREDVAFFVIRVDGVPAGCGGVQIVGEGYAELKRMYVRPEFRGRGLGKLMLERLTAHAIEHGIRCLRLETGIHQSHAIALYERCGFSRIPPFGAYERSAMSVCFEKELG